MGKTFDKLKERWGVENYWQVVLILFIFSITGMSALYVRKFVFGMIGINGQTPTWIKIIAWLLTVFPSYQILFLFYGFIFGQFQFVWNFEKKSFKRIKALFSKNAG